MNTKLKLGIFLFFFGFIGILSLLSTDIPLTENAKQIIRDLLTPQQIKILSLINPTIFLGVATLCGTVIYDKVDLKVPVVTYLITKTKLKTNIYSIFKTGISGGIIAGVLITVISNFFQPLITQNFINIESKFRPSLITRLLYGGITEEIIVRFGLMTFIVYITSNLAKSLISTVFWIGIILSALIFGIGHLPLVYTLIDSPSTLLITYIILGNCMGGIIFGWIYWKKGLESAIIAHIIAHLTMFLIEVLL